MKDSEDTYQNLEDIAVQDLNYVELLHFTLGKENILILTKDLQQLVLPVPYTYVPMAPDHMLGMANVRGQIICVLDLAKMLDIEVDVNSNEQNHCIILNYQRMHIGLVVGVVKGIYRILEEDYAAAKRKKGEHSAMKGSLDYNGLECQVLEISRLLK
ncbi:MAG: chemotaxis protein CheW [Mariprofundaceae bacterium]|nr:chemotaxis protein CheW [Mariprofundaceae bacterium]